jgi:hypothetical protein
LQVFFEAKALDDLGDGMFFGIAAAAGAVCNSDCCS